MEVVEMETTYELVDEWLTKVVIGLNLCPFAARPQQMQLIDIIVSDAQSHDQLLADLHYELKRLADTPAMALETTLVATPHLLKEFNEYNQFLEIVERLIQHIGLEGEIQVASFHPHYRFDGTEPEAPENLTNRSPVPIFHLIRELSISEALKYYREPDQIPKRNIDKMNSLTAEQKRHYFHYLYEKG